MAFSLPPWEYWNPIHHEYGTTYRVFDLLVNQAYDIEGHPILLSSYGGAILNLLPGFTKPTGFVTFSTAMSAQLAEGGEGLGNSPIGEVVYNWYFPAIAFQCLPMWIFALMARRRWKAKWGPRINLAASGALVICAFNFWRIGAAEVLKIGVSFVIGVIAICALLVRDSGKPLARET